MRAVLDTTEIGEASLTKEAYLHVQNLKNDKFKKRWVVFEGTKVTYYADNKPGQEPVATFDLTVGASCEILGPKVGVARSCVRVVDVVTVVVVVVMLVRGAAARSWACAHFFLNLVATETCSTKH